MAVNLRNTEMIGMLSADFVRKQVPLILYGSISGYAEIELSAVAGTAITVIEDAAATDVKAALRYEALVAESGGGIAAASGALGLAAADNLYDDGVDVLTLTVNADGSVEVQRTAGAATFDLAISLRWL